MSTPRPTCMFTGESSVMGKAWKWPTRPGERTGKLPKGTQGMETPVRGRGGPREHRNRSIEIALLSEGARQKECALHAATFSSF